VNLIAWRRRSSSQASGIDLLDDRLASIMSKILGVLIQALEARFRLAIAKPCFVDRLKLAIFAARKATVAGAQEITFRLAFQTTLRDFGARSACPKVEERKLIVGILLEWKKIREKKTGLLKEEKKFGGYGGC